MERQFIILMLMMTGFTLSSLQAGEVSIPNNFSAGSTAVAAEVNGNFTAVSTAVNDNNGRVGNLETRADALDSDLSVVSTKVNTQTSDLSVLLKALVPCPSNSPTRFVDNGDGTICDHQTGLMWEKKDAADGTPDLTNPHDVDNIYRWGNVFATGLAFTDFLTRLNGVEAGSTHPEQLGGYNDWRLPTSAELQTLLLEPFPCSISPCIIAPIFAPTAASIYWSSTSLANAPGSGNPSNAWFVNFFNGFVGNDSKTFQLQLRAVRDGRKPPSPRDGPLLFD